MFSLDPKTASASLLAYLDTLLGPPLVEFSSRTSERVSLPVLKEHRSDLENISKQLGKCSSIIAILLHSLDEIKKSRDQLVQHQTHLLDEANQLVAAERPSIHLPNEILCLIARHVYPVTMPTVSAVYYLSSGCKWGKIVCQSSLIELDEKTIKSSSIWSFLSNSSPAKLLVYLPSRWHLPELAILSLLPSRGRWHSLSVSEGRFGDAVRGLLHSIPCPNCPPRSKDGRKECRHHTILPSLDTFTASHRTVPSYLGLLKNLRHLTLHVTNLDNNPVAIDYTELASGFPSLSELTILWRSRTFQKQSTEIQDRARFPNLKKVTYVLRDDLIVSRVDLLQSVFGLLDCRGVEELQVSILHSSNECTDFPEFLKVLDETFPSVNSMAVRAETWLNLDEYRDEILLCQRDFLEALTPSPDKRPIFPHLNHLSLELDPTDEGLKTLLQVLDGYRGNQGQGIRSLDLFELERYSRYSRIAADSIHFIARVQACVQHVTVRAAVKCYDAAYSL